MSTEKNKHNQPKGKIGEILLKKESITKPQLEEGLRKQTQTSKKLGDILIELGYISEEELATAMATQLGKNYEKINPSLLIDIELLNTFPKELIDKHTILPIVREQGIVKIVTCNALPDSVLDEIENTAKCKIEFIISSKPEIKNLIEKAFQRLNQHKARDKKVGSLLLEKGLITQEQLSKALHNQSVTHQKLGNILMNEGYITEETLLKVLGEKYGLEFVEFNPKLIDPRLSYGIPRSFAIFNEVLPIFKEGSSLVVAVNDPLDLNVIDNLTFLLNSKIKTVLSTTKNIREGINHVFGTLLISSTVEEVSVTEVNAELEDSKYMLESAKFDSTLRDMINNLLYQSIRQGASDIHIEEKENDVIVRYRKDGVLLKVSTPLSKKNIPRVISHLKINAGLNITERRRPQEGRFGKVFGKSDYYDFRLTIQPSLFGEDAVIRILDQSAPVPDMKDLGFSAEITAKYKRLIENPQGMILITGPTGSGKTTTLYSTINAIKSTEKKIVSAEDPVEYSIAGVNQYQVNEIIGNTFGRLTRQFLRLDPDIIMIGEIRDEETAVTAIRASQTGHLVFSTLHTNDSVGAIPRLSSFKLDANSVSESLLLVVSQRLARRICAKCKTEYEPKENFLKEFYNNPPKIKFHQGTGCDLCNNTGYSKRVMLYEFWELENNDKILINQEEDKETIERKAVENGMKPLIWDALEKAEQGLTTLEEIRRIVPLSQIKKYKK